MSNIAVFDIETYRPNWQNWRSRREDFDPARNYIVTAGIFNGTDLYISPVIEDLQEERKSVEFFLKHIAELEDTTLVGYNILRFDIPYVVYKSELAGQNFDATKFRVLDLYWILPYWLHNVPRGKEFYRRLGNSNNLWKFEDVARIILNQEANPISNREINRLWEEKSS